MTRTEATIRETDQAAIALARRLVRTAQSGSLAVLDPDQSGFPHSSRVTLGLDTDGVLFTLVSALAPHRRAMEQDPRCSLLVGEIGKGDPLAHPRLSLRCLAQPVDRETPEHNRLRDRHLRRQPKAALYIDLPDFRFFRLTPIFASLNGGFGRAYRIEPDDLLISSRIREALAKDEDRLLELLNEPISKHAQRLATMQTGQSSSSRWLIVGLDAAGLDLRSEEQFLRVEFNRELASTDELTSELHKLYG
ncbi:HugZ family protein [Rhizobium sp. YIM 134829]|uniref:HugZ family pyridoxamine 5'-phosphate oxidase n=1 Tax=Rhizobium sp. YIM 134829 TaxID=3390453 RepID=UPI00397B0877